MYAFGCICSCITPWGVMMLLAVMDPEGMHKQLSLLTQYLFFSFHVSCRSFSVLFGVSNLEINDSLCSAAPLTSSRYSDLAEYEPHPRHNTWPAAKGLNQWIVAQSMGHTQLTSGQGFNPFLPRYRHTQVSLLTTPRLLEYILPNGTYCACTGKIAGSMCACERAWCMLSKANRPVRPDHAPSMYQYVHAVYVHVHSQT